MWQDLNPKAQIFNCESQNKPTTKMSLQNTVIMHKLFAFFFNGDFFKVYIVILLVIKINFNLYLV